MANTKISALTAATTPVAGTEVLPIVQSSTTKQVSIANLTAGRSVSAADYVMSTGNLVPSTAAKGINFTSNTPAAGMTSQLLNWYEEGTWTPTGNGVTLTNNSAVYVRIGSLVSVSFDITWPITTNTSAANVSGLPFTVNHAGGAAIGYNTSGIEIHYNAGSGAKILNAYLNNGSSPTNVQLTGARLIGSCTYFMN
jgi:hypothetical protein